MINTFLTYLNEGSHYYGLELCEYPEGLKYHFVEVKRSKHELFILREKTFTSLDDLNDVLQNGVPLFLVINTAQVLNKIIEPQGDTSHQAHVHQAFPNLNFENFYYEGIRAKKKLLIAICKKENVNQHLESLSKLKLDIVNISLGISALGHSVVYMPDEKLPLSNVHVVIKEGSVEKIASFDQNDFDLVNDFDINGLTVHSPYILSFSSVLGHLLKRNEFIDNLGETRTHLKSEFTNKRHFKLLLKSSLVVILLLLLVNFLVFDHYYRGVDALRESLSVNSAQQEQLLQLKADVVNKKNRLNAVLAISNSTTSFFLDEIAMDVPVSILLTKIQYQPLEKPMRDAKPLELIKNIIVVAGEATHSGDFYAWIETLEKSSWIAHIETTDYDYGNGNTSNFSLKIFLNEE